MGMRASLLLTALAGCADASPSGPCAENFCLPAGAKIVSKSNPVEDFNLYQIDWKGARFGIYEGNHPQRRADVKQPINLPIDPAASIDVQDGRGSIIVSIGKHWPAYLDVMGPCKGSAHCLVTDFAHGLRKR
jgi:hypothetical protein